MPISKKQFEFVIRGRVVAVNSAGSLTLANLQTIVEGFSLNGVEYDLTTPSTVGTGDEAVTFNTVVADRTTPANTSVLTDVTDAVEVIIGDLKTIT